jgi:GntR family transcriptional regulator
VKVLNTSTQVEQVKVALVDYIRHNKLARNSQLPSEANIAKSLGVSRNTVREAYILLENEGTIVRRHGIGTFIAQPPRIKDSLDQFVPFANIIEKEGYTPHFQTFSNAIVVPPDDVADALKQPPGTQIRCLKRLVLADDQPALYVIDYFSPLIEQAGIDWDQFDGNLVHFLSQHLSSRLYQIHTRIRAVALEAPVSEYMALPDGTAVLSVRSTIYNLDNDPITFSRIFFNSDIVELTTLRTIQKI